ncbi:MAG: recombination-associated protein RdgC [Gammaproteobacteria bacterium]|nr:recombination-associated protein RdgC [Gammaproteobacteria bacterium]
MWFKNLRLYCLTQPFDLLLEDLESQLAENAFIPCANYEKSRIGWVTPLGNAANVNAEGDATDNTAATTPVFTHVVGDYIMLCAQRQDRLLPASVVREATEKKIAELEARQARKIYRKEKREIQDDMFNTLLPRAFTRSTQVYAYISRSEKLLVVNTASASKAEEFLNLLRDTLGSFPVALPDSKRAPSDVMTRWLKGQKATDKFEINNDCELLNPKDMLNVVRCKGQDLVGEEIQAHLNAGKQVKQLGVLWNSLLSCIIVDDLSIKSLRFEEMKAEPDSFEEESAAQKFDQEFALMTLELSAFFKALFKAFGGLEDPRNKPLPDNRQKEKQ